MGRGRVAGGEGGKRKRLKVGKLAVVSFQSSAGRKDEEMKRLKD
jgi:hypothetical protein